MNLKVMHLYTLDCHRKEVICYSLTVTLPNQAPWPLFNYEAKGKGSLNLVPLTKKTPKHFKAIIHFLNDQLAADTKIFTPILITPCCLSLIWPSLTPLGSLSNIVYRSYHNAARHPMIKSVLLKDFITHKKGNLKGSFCYCATEEKFLIYIQQYLQGKYRLKMCFLCYTEAFW